MAKSAALAFSVSKIGLDQQQVGAAVDQRARRLRRRRRPARRSVTLRKPGSLTSGDSEAVRLVGPERAGDEARPAGARRRPRPRPARASCAAARFSSRDQRLQCRSRPCDGALALKVLVSMMSAPASRYAAMDLARSRPAGSASAGRCCPCRSRGQSREALAAIVGLVEPVALDHRAHRAVEHEDALAEQAAELASALRSQHGSVSWPRRGRGRTPSAWQIA